MIDQAALKKKIQELIDRDWDTEATNAWFSKLNAEGIPRKNLFKEEIIANKGEILDRVQRKAEECEHLGHTCATGAALPVMEEFGLGNMEVIQALYPFPGFGGTGRICGAVSGGLAALGLYFSIGAQGEGMEKAIAAMYAAREFLQRFKDVIGSVQCSEIQENEIFFGRFIDALASDENIQALFAANYLEKCALPTGIGARLAAEIIIESMEQH